MSSKTEILRKVSKDSGQCQIAAPEITFFAPILIVVALAALLVNSLTSEFTQGLLEENQPVELLTFAIALWTAFKAFQFAQKQTRKKNKSLALFYLLFALVFFFFAMEEIAWGQQFLKFDTPDFWEIRNAQDELTLHNYNHPSVQYLESLPLAAGFVGLLGIWANWADKLPKRICPPLILFSWFATVTLHSGIDLFHEFYIFSGSFDELINHLDEAAEMLVAMAGLLHVHFNSQRLSG